MKRSLICALTGLLLLVGCSYETFFEEGNGGLYSLNVSVEDCASNSRAGFNLNNGGSFFWNNGDAIAVGSSVLTQFTTSASDGSTSAMFTGYSEPSGYAIYPWSGTQSISRNTLVYKYANTYTYESVDTDFFNGMSVEIPMWGNVVDNAVMFKHLGGIIAFKFPNLKAGANQVFTMIADSKISGVFSADLTSGTPMFETTTTDVQASDKQVTINFSLDSDADAVFYVPVPTGVYEFTIKIQNGEDVFTCAYKNLTVDRRDIRYTIISAHTLQGSEAIEVENPEEVTDVLKDNNSVVVESIVSSTPDSEVSIEIPTKVSGADEMHTITISSIDENTETINISEVVGGTGNSIKELVINMPTTEDAKKLNIDMPNTSVTIVANGVEVLTLGEVTAITADNTLIVENNVVINKLIVAGGNVRIKEGAKVLEIVNSDDNKNVTYVIYEGAIPASVVNTEYVKHVDATYYDILQICQASGAQEIVLNKNISLASALTIANNTNLTIDLNGYAISYESDIMAHSSMINVTKGSSLTVKDSGNGGKISYTYTGEGDSQFGWGTYTIINSGDLVVEDGTIEMLCDLNTPGNVIHMYSAIQQSGATGTTTINGGTISTPTYRSIRINGGALEMNGGVMDGQVWLQPNQGNVTITVTGGEYSPSPIDGSSIFMTNQGEGYTVSSATITGGTFATKIGSTNPTLEGVAGCVTGGIFTESAKNNTNANLIATGYDFVEEDGMYKLILVPGNVVNSVEELNEALADDEVTLIKLGSDITITNTILVTRSVTIDGNGNAIRYKGAAGGRIIDVKKEYPNVDFTLLNISLLNSTNSYIERGVNYNTNGKLTLDNVTIGSENGQVITYAVNMPTSAKDAVVDIKNSSITGNIALNVWSQNNEITIENSDLYTYDTSDVEGYAVVKLNNDGINIAEGSIINIIGGSVKVTYKNPEDVNISYSINNKTLTGEIIVSETTEVVGDIKYATVIVAYKNSDNSYDFASLQAAINKAAETPQSVDEIRLIRDIQLNEPVTIPAGLSVILNLNGKSITQTSDAPVSMIINDGNLTIKDSGNTGKIAFTFNGTPNNAKPANVVANKGVLIVNGGEIINSGSGNQIGYAIDNYNGASLTINGGKVAASGSSYYDGIRLFCGSKETVVTVNNGEVSSIWAQNPSNNKAAEVSGTVIINGGTVSATYYENYTTVKVATGVTASVSPYGAGSDNTTSTVVDGYTVYSFVH